MSQWSLFQSIIAGLLVAIVAWVAARYWSHRRLYLVTRYYSQSALSDTGKAVSFTVLNRGQRAEQNVSIELDPAREYALLAASTQALQLVRNVLSIEALPAREDVSAIVQVDGGDFDNDNILRFSSTEALGRVFKKLEEAPPSPGVAPFIIGLIFVALGAIASIAYQIGSDDGELRAISSQKAPLGASTLSDEQKVAATALKTDGWLESDKFVTSNMAGNYPAGKFPVTARAVRRIGNFVLVLVDIENRGDDWLTVTASATSTQRPARGSCEATVTDDFFHDKIVPAKTKASAQMIAYVPTSSKVDEQVIRFSVSLGYKQQSVYEIYRYIDVSSVSSETVAGGQCPTPQPKPPQNSVPRKQ
jgi:hypothetical protein